MNITTSALSHSDLYGLILNAVAPRADRLGFHSQRLRPAEPRAILVLQLRLHRAAIAGVCSRAACAEAIELSDGEAKDTLRNIRETREFVINMVTFELAKAMNATSGEYDASVNEFELATSTARRPRS